VVVGGSWLTTLPHSGRQIDLEVSVETQMFIADIASLS
jgi:hypothetical protein